MKIDIYNMKLHEQVWIAGLQSDVYRVPGGWLYSTSDGRTGGMVSSVFVPFNDEFMERIE